MLNSWRKHPFFIKLTNWEYWPFDVVYAPIYVYWVWLMIKARSAFFINAANPAITNGGFLMESKKLIYDLIPAQYYPATIFLQPNTPMQRIELLLAQNQLNFPLIAKPDIGMRGMQVQKIANRQQLETYALQSQVNYLVQEYVPYTNEVGIFYCRYPWMPHGFVSGIVGKELLTVTGNGKDTVEELIKQEQRHILQLAVLKKTEPQMLLQIPQAGEEVLLVPYGNHCRGAKFIDISHLADEHFTSNIDAICRQIPGFYFGRLDVRYKNWNDLREGKNLSIIELNGAGSEPTHIYDPAHSIWYAWKEIIRHLNIMFRISEYNHRQQQIAYMPFKAGLQMLRDNSNYVKLLMKQQ